MLEILRRTAAEIAAAALFETYPNVLLQGGSETDVGFEYAFSCPHPIQPQVLEDKISQIIKEKRPIKTLEMVAFSAKELLKKEGHLHRAQATPEGLVEVIQMGNFFDLSFGPHLKNTNEIGAIKIRLEGNKIIGFADVSKQNLKQFLKKLDQYVSGEEKGEQLGLWKGPIWFQAGISARNEIQQFLKKEWFTGAIEVSVSADRENAHRSLGKNKVAEIADERIYISFFGQTEGNFTSHLQMIGKTLNMLGFDHTAISHSCGVDFVIEDELGRKKPLVKIEKTGKKEYLLTASVEKMMVSQLEQGRLLNMGIH